MPRLASIETTAQHLDCSTRTVRNYIARGFFPAYKVPRRRGLLTDLDEVERAMARIPTSKARLAYGDYGPNANIKALPPQPEVVTKSGDER